MRTDHLASIAAGLNLAQNALQLEAETAFLKTLVAKDPYPPQREFISSFKHIKALFGANQCLAADSSVLMACGDQKRIDCCEVGDEVVAYDFRVGGFVPAKILAVIRTPLRRIFRFVHPQGILNCSAKHRVCVLSEVLSRPTMVKASRAAREHMPVIGCSDHYAPVLGFLQRQGYVDRDEVYDLTIDHPDHAFVCNGIVVSNSGKSHTAAYNIAWDATGEYPDDYTGPRTTRGIDAWVIGDTAINTREACQKKLFGPDPTRPGWTDRPGVEALINAKYIVGKPSMQSVSGCIDSVRVKHVRSDTTSIISFKSHNMETQSLASWAGDRVWIDEEAPKELLDEMIARVTTRNGYIYITLCPLHGVTPMVKFLQDNAGGPDVFLAYLTDEDAKHISPEVRERNRRLWASDPAMLAARSKGQATSNSGLIFPFPTESILYDPSDFKISNRWKYLGGLDVGWRHPTAACAAAWDPQSDTIFAYATYEKAETDYFTHHANLLRWGSTMTFMIDPASDQVNQAEGGSILEKYWTLAHGEDWAEIEESRRKYVKANNRFHPGMNDMWHRFNTQRLRIRRDLRNLIEQYGNYEWNKDGDGPMRETPIRRYDIITALRYLVMGVQDYAHRLDDTPPWLESDYEAPIDIPAWRPYKSGQGGPRE